MELPRRGRGLNRCPRWRRAAGPGGAGRPSANRTAPGSTGAGAYYGVELEHPDGRRRGCGFGGPITWPGSPVNSYVGRSDGGPVVVPARSRDAEPQVVVAGVAEPPVWTGRADGVGYLLHLVADGREVAVAVSR